MKTAFLLILIVWLSTTFAPGQNKQLSISYNIDLQFYPDSNYIVGRAEIRQPGDSVYILDKSLVVKSLTADGRKVSFHQKACESVPHSVEIALESIPLKIIIEYSGNIIADHYPRTISSLNQINSNLIELSNHIDWYPRFKGWPPFSFNLKVDVPANYNTIINGKLIGGEKTKGKRQISTWQSESSAYSITMLSVPGMVKSELTKDGHTIEIYSSQLPSSYVDSMKYCLLQAVQMLDSLFGPAEDEKLVRVVYSPRQAGAYARRPLIVISENYALEQRGHSMGFARDFRLNCHEIAHYWSRARSDTPDDWINEGLAEFSALLISEKIIGKEFATMLIKEYQGIIDGTPTQTAIVATTDGSVEREINRYYKPTFLLSDLREKVGEDKLKGFFRLLYQKFDQANTATTALFLEALKESTDSETEAFFREAIYRKGWENEKQSSETLLSKGNEIFLGKWSGILTQFGASTRFILNLVSEGGKIIPTLDSPDQDVTGIPASDLQIQDDSISYKLGMASAAYKGRLDREKMLIEGIWTQRNIDYPLKVTKVKENE